MNPSGPRMTPPQFNPGNFPPPVPRVPSAPTAAQLKPGKSVTMPATLSVSGVAATVNGQQITNQQLVASFLRDGGQATLRQLITTAELEQAARKAHVSVTDAEVTSSLEATKEQAVEQSQGQTWSNVLASHGYSEQFAREQTRLQLLAEKVALATSGQPAFSLRDKIHVYHILLLTEQVPQGNAPQTDSAALAKITQILADIRAHKITFQQAAKKYSQDPGTASKGGDLGWVGQSDPLDPAFKTAALGLKEGQISQPVKSQFGYHLIYVPQFGTHATPAEVNAAADASIQQRAEPLVRQFVTQLEATSHVQNILVPAPPVTPSPFGAGGPGGPGSIPVPRNYRGPIAQPGNPNAGARPISVPPGTPGAIPAPLPGAGAATGARPSAAPAPASVPPPPPL